MSLVGTRPPTVDEWEKYELHHRSRMSTKPGITGMWQVSGRSDITDFEEVVRLDTEYMEKQDQQQRRTESVLRQRWNQSDLPKYLEERKTGACTGQCQTGKRRSIKKVLNGKELSEAFDEGLKNIYQFLPDFAIEKEGFLKEFEKLRTQIS